MRVFITGASGWIGTALTRDLVASGHEVVGLARSEASAARISALGHIAAVVAGLESDGKIVVVVRVDGQVVGVLGLEDRLRSSSTATVAALTDLTGNRPVLLTGDNQRAATALADRVGITDVRAGLLPHDKVTAVRALEADGSRVFSSATVSTTPLPSPLRTPGSPWAERAPTSPSTPQTPSSSATNYRPSRR